MGKLDQLLRKYEKANNSHDWNNVAPFVHPNASYFFTDGTFNGIAEIKQAITNTFEKIKDEIYTISNVVWKVDSENVAVCIYDFHWKGVVDGQTKEGSGRGTNVWVNQENGWQIIHEHLSK
jgi:ketosteroid isomerase-like protein